MTKQNVTAFVVGLAFFLAFGGFAVFLGQDTSWDTLNYHVYNPYAFLTDRIDIDLAPAQLQSYFSPVLDLPVYWLTQHLQPWLVGFWVGGFQGLNALMVFLIARQLLSTADTVPFWTPLFLASLGCLNASFVAQLGTAAGDSSSSPFVLLALYLACLWHETLTKGTTSLRPWAVWIGLLMGLAVGLKLTNAPFALAIVLVLAVLPIKPADKLRQISLYGLSALASLMLTSGWWFYQVWVKFGNPLFPQFNSIFKSDLASATSIIDTRWGPINALEALAWPLWMSLRPWRLHDGLLYNHLWLTTYLALLACLASYLWRRVRGLEKQTSPAWLVLFFVPASYVIWLKVFSIGRYMTVVEMLLPLLLLIGLKGFVWPKLSVILAFMLTVFSLVLSLKHSNFGVRATWEAQSYSVSVPPIQQPTTATVLIAAGGAPISWLLPNFPSQTAVLRISGNFPRSEAYDRLMHQTVAARAGKVYAIIPIEVDWTVSRAAQLDTRLAASELMQWPVACELMNRLAHTMRRYRGINIYLGADDRCHATIGDEASAYSRSDHLSQSAQELSNVGFRLATETCRIYPASVGGLSMPFQFCEVKKMIPQLDHTKLTRLNSAELENINIYSKY